MTSCLGFMHPRVAFLDSGYMPKWKSTFKSHTEKNADLAVKLFNILGNFIEGKISEIPEVKYVSISKPYISILARIIFTFLNT